MKSKHTIINTLSSLEGISDDCDRFIVDAIFAIESTEEDVITELLRVVDVEVCVAICLLDQPWMTERYSDVFIIEATLLFKRTLAAAMSSPYRFDA